MNNKYLTKEQKALIRGEHNCVAQLRKKGYWIKKKEIVCDHKSLDDFPRGPRYYADKLLKLGYKIQLEAFDHVN